ncbi:MAG: Smr/MutS family protein [Trueperaceae bacterium]
MRVLPTTLEKLAFPRVLDALAERCQTFAGQARARALLPDLEGDALRAAHECVDEALTGDAISLGGVEDVRPLVERVQEGGMLEGPECLAIAYTMDAAATVKRAIALSNRPRLTELARGLASFDAVLRLVREQLDASGEVRDDATPKLREIRKRLHPMRGRIRDRMAQLLQQYAPYVQDPIVTLRRDRYVIPVKASAQSRVPGLVLDTSDSGATVFVEPAAVVPLNNELTLLEFEERDEVRRILIALGQRLAFDPGLEPTLAALTELDLVVASARLARDWALVRPEVAEGAAVRLPGARHPLIENCVPNDILLDAEAPLLVLTGPNAGGKTVLLKTLGLAVLMAHAGLFVAAAARAADGRPSRATLPPFRSVLTDIGDEQSIEASLSTYAAHLTNLRRIVEDAAPGTLLLIDELGSGTDPDEGAALSQAILEAVVERRAFGVVTTHLAPLKVFAAQRAGVRNAAMRFDVERLRPTFELVVGQPGRSYALAIAERVGLSPELLARAHEVLGPEGARLERLLETLETQRAALQAQLDEAEGARAAAVAEAELLRAQIERLRAQEAALLEQAAEKADALLQDTLARAKAWRETARSDPAQRGKAMEAISQLRRETKRRAPAAARPAAADRLAPGAIVRVDAYGAEGPVVEVRGDQLVVQLGLLKVEVARHEATVVRAPDAAKGPKAPVTPGAGFERELNVRGERVEEAIEKVRDLVREAHALQVESVRVLHGKGTGALRDAVRRYLKDERLVERFEDAVPYEGGFGVTVAYLRPR